MRKQHNHKEKSGCGIVAVVVALLVVAVVTGFLAAAVAPGV